MEEAVTPAMQEIRVLMMPTKTTQNTKKFEEVVPSGGAQRLKSPVYVTKEALKALGNPPSVELVIRPMGGAGRG